MKKIFVITIALFTILSFQSCLEDTCTTVSTYYVYEPVYMTEAELRAGIQLENSKDLKNPGKMYFYNDMIFINEQYEGVHIYDNSDPASPSNIGFISIPGNIDISIKDDILYADGLIDIMSIDISNMSNPTVTSTISDIFDAPFDPELGYVVYYTPVKTTEEYSCDQNWLIDDWIALEIDNVGPNFNPGIPLNNAGSIKIGRTGVGGSTARMTIAMDYLYIVDNNSLKTVNIQNNQSLMLENSIDLGWGIETIYPYQEKLFIGSETGMFIFSNENPSMPELLSEFRHWRACDPVVVEGNTAYVTLRDGDVCAGFNNQLDVINITDVLNPELIKTIPMINPHGLAIRNNTLYICEGTEGLKIFNVEDATTAELNELIHDNSFHAVDAISLSEDILFIIGEDGFRQYDVSNKEEPILLSTITASN